MSEQLKEALSAVVDGEADVFELRRVLDEVGRSPELSAAWRRYHLIGEHLRGEQVLLPESALAEMSDSVWRGAMDDIDDAGLAERTEVAEQPRIAALRSVPTGTDSEASKQASLLKRWVPFAVAASVALAVTLGFYSFSLQTPEPELAQTDIEIEGPVFQVSTEVSPSDIQRANAYMLHHVQQKALNQPGVASFVKVVTFEKAE